MTGFNAHDAMLFWNVVISVLDWALPLFVFSGLFEDRENGNYVFRTRRFFSVVLCLFLLNIFVAVPLVYEMGKDYITTDDMAELTVLKKRMTLNFTDRNLSTMLPEDFGNTTRNCYHAAVSNFIEDDWNKSYRSEFCVKSANACTDKLDDHYDAIKLYLRRRPGFLNKIPTVYSDMYSSGLFLGAVEVIAASSYKIVHQFTHYIHGNGQTSEPPDQQTIENYHSYFTSCSTLKPPPWSDINEELLKSHPNFCVGMCAWQ